MQNSGNLRILNFLCSITSKNTYFFSIDIISRERKKLDLSFTFIHFSHSACVNYKHNAKKSLKK